MSVPLVQNSFITGEIAPSIFGRQDLARYHTACSTLRNFFASYRGPAYSRAGTMFVGYSKQTGRAFPPRLIPFQFSITQGLALEFGNFYMRVISDGAFVTEAQLSISNITQSDPAVVTATAEGVASATSVNTNVVSSYASGNTVTLAGGAPTTPAVLLIDTTALLTAVPVDSGNGASGSPSYAPGEIITLAGGVSSLSAAVTINITQVVGVVISAPGTGGTNGAAVVTGTTGTGTKFQINVTIAGGAITALGSFITQGRYTVNPASLSAAPVTGAGLTGATLTIVMGVQNVSVSAGGSFTVNPTGALTQAATTGAGTGATFQGIFGPSSVSVQNAGVYTALPVNPVAQASTSGNGLGVLFNITGETVAPFNTGDWVFISDVEGMTQINGVTAVVNVISTTEFTLFDVFGEPINSEIFSPYAGGGLAARIFTLPTIYGEADLPYLKFVQSADDMSICCVNQQTKVEYPAQDLKRVTDDSWVFTPIIPAATVGPPPGQVTAIATDGGIVNYAYEVTAVSAVDGSESIASNIAIEDNAVDIASVGGSITITWNAVSNALNYNVYKALPSDFSPVATGSIFGFASIANGTRLVDSNIVPDFSQVPPTHQNPFAPGQILFADVLSSTSDFTEASATIISATGSGAVLGVSVNTVLTTVLGGGVTITPGPVSAIEVLDAGQNYMPGDTIAISGDGASATAVLKVGPQTGTFPSVPGYYQERRVYANTLNDPDTYFMSQPGSFTNFDTRNPTIASDAITGSPWATQVNGIQWVIQTSGGLLVLTGLSAWLLAGVGSFATNVTAISPSNQDDVPQAFSGCSSIIPPTKINYDVIYANPQNNRYYDLPYQLYALSEPIDLTEVSPHLFDDFTIRENAWCEQPNKLMWAVRDDGVLLSMTYYKTQQVSGWARHDTNGLFVSVCSVIELPVNALYVATQRNIATHTSYMIERMDNRIWNDVESTWCVDCGLALPQPAPPLTLFIASPSGLGSLTGVTNLVGGKGYSANTVATAIDRATQADGITPVGSGAIPVLTIIGGVITAVTFPVSQGKSYLLPEVVVADPAGSAGGSGFSARPILNNASSVTASGAAFANVGDVLRASGGVAVVTVITDSEHATVNVLTPFPPVMDGAVDAIYISGNWTLTTPVSTVSGLDHLIGVEVTGLADGNVIPPTVVDATGSITLDPPASAVTVGLGFQAQLQGVYGDAGSPTIQGQRKKETAVTVRIEASRGVKVGTNQVDGSTLSPPSLAPTWDQMQLLPDDGPDTPNWPPRPFNALATPLRTGDVRTVVSGGWRTPGQIAVQQDFPLPCNVLALIPEMLPGDTVQTQAPAKQPKGGR